MGPLLGPGEHCRACLWKHPVSVQFSWLNLTEIKSVSLGLAQEKGLGNAPCFDWHSVKKIPKILSAQKVQGVKHEGEVAPQSILREEERAKAFLNAQEVTEGMDTGSGIAPAQSLRHPPGSLPSAL